MHVPIAMEVELQLKIGDHAWEAGALVSARSAYARAAELAPISWHAAFQLASIDLAFGAMPRPAIECVLATAPTPRWRDALLARAENRAPLEGGIAAWDIVRLRCDSLRSGQRHWEQLGMRAHSAKLYGLARACFDEASNLTSVHDYAVPRLYADAIVAARVVLTELARCDRTGWPL
jgi:hypothetical protein